MANSEKISLRNDSKFYNKDLTDKTMMGKKLRGKIPLPDQDYDPSVCTD